MNKNDTVISFYKDKAIVLSDEGDLRYANGLAGIVGIGEVVGVPTRPIDELAPNDIIAIMDTIAISRRNSNDSQVI